MADRTWQIEHRGEFRLALRRATSLPRGNKRDYVSAHFIATAHRHRGVFGSANNATCILCRGFCTLVLFIL